MTQTTVSAPTIHAHVSTHSRDCDGLYDRSWVAVPKEGETETQFRLAMTELYRPSDPEAWFLAVEWGFEFSEPTEEGFSAGEVRFCTDDDADERGTFRDHSAEAAGY